MSRTILLCAFVFLTVLSCKTKQKASNLQLSAENEVIFLDSTAAAAAIILDRQEGFFEKITSLEMSIQMKQEKVSSDRNVVLEEYKEYLQQDVESFTPQEQEFVNKTMKEAYLLAQAINSDIFPKKIRLIKTKGKHYGNSVYYTREDMIIIPENELEAENFDQFLNVMLHEISHIYSRYNPAKRHQLYDLIGFKPLSARPVIPVALQNRILFNPDGININYSMDLTTNDGKAISVLPIIVAGKDAFSASRPAFFDYVKFDLYELKKNENNSFEVITDKAGFSTLTLGELGDFFKQIKDNTQYIIHPDEIIADNFMYVLKSSKNGGSFKQYSEEGAQLLRDIKKILAKK